jgi:hypothetical protein
VTKNLPVIPQEMLDRISMSLERPTIRHSDDEFRNYAYNEGIEAGLEHGAPTIIEWAVEQERKRILDVFDSEGPTGEASDPFEELYRDLRTAFRIRLEAILTD